MYNQITEVFEMPVTEAEEEGEAPRFTTTLSDITVNENSTMVLEVRWYPLTLEMPCTECQNERHNTE